MITRPAISRRAFLHGSGVCLALPFLEAMMPRNASAAAALPPKRMVFACASLGIYGPSLFPKETGTGYVATPYLEALKGHRADFTVFSGVCHPDQAGADGHTSEMTWLTSARGPGLGGFRNSISVDQYVAEKIGFETRYPSLALSTAGQSSQSYTRSGVMVQAQSKPSQVFAKLFLDGTPGEVFDQMRKLKEGRSIMDTVQESAKRFGRRVGAADKEKLDEYYTSVREMEERMLKAEAWVQKPKPKVEAKPPTDVTNEADLIARMRLLFDLIPLALQTDSTRAITVLIQGRGDVPPVPGVTIDHHNLSHHGQDPMKIEQLQRIEREEFSAYNDLLTSLKSKKEGGGTLLDNTMVMFGSNLGNANSHDWHNLPLLLAGGGFKHGQHLAFDAKNNMPMCNLFVQMLQRMGLETDHFGTSSASALPGLV
ncbi:MAG: signal peptide protein [Verrucomicrobiaceae bacterium]|nr:signal peptide protein [Verrucomicrobiaceae bacterium]